MSYKEFIEHMYFDKIRNRIVTDKALQTTLASIWLGDQYEIASGARNVFFTDTTNQYHLSPVWAVIKDQENVANQGPSGIIPGTLRTYVDNMITAPFVGVESNPITYTPYIIADPGTSSLLSIYGLQARVENTLPAGTVLALEIRETDANGILIYKKETTIETEVLAGNFVEMWLHNPLESDGVASASYTTLVIVDPDGTETPLSVSAADISPTIPFANIHFRSFVYNEIAKLDGDESSAKFQIDSITKGFLPPRLTTTERDAITSPLAGLEIYNTTTSKPNFYNGTAWSTIADSLWTDTGGSIHPANIGDRVLIGTVTSTGSKLQIESSSSSALPIIELKTTGSGGGGMAFTVGVNVPTAASFAGSLHFHNNQSGPGGLYVNTSTVSGADWTLLDGGAGGDNGEVQYNNNGVLDGISGVKTDGQNILLSGRLDGAGIGGALTLRAASNSPIGGEVIIQGGGASGTGGKVRIEGGLGGNSGGNIELHAGDGPSDQSGHILLIAGSGDDTGAGGDIFLTGGNAGFQSGKGGDIVFKSGDAEGSGEDSGDITLDAGTSLDGNVGDILLARASGRAGVGVSFVDDSAQFEVSSASRGFLKPRMTTPEKLNITSPATGLEVFDITINRPEFYSGTAWESGLGNETLAETLADGNTTGGNDLIVSPGDVLLAEDIISDRVVFGDNADVLLTHDGTEGFITNLTGDMTLDNYGLTNNIILRIGTNFDVTKFIVRNSSDVDLISVDGEGKFQAKELNYNNSPSVTKQIEAIVRAGQVGHIDQVLASGTHSPISPQPGPPLAIAIAGDGGKVFIGDNSSQIRGYDLSTPWDITTASAQIDSFNPGFSAGSVNFNPSGLILITSQGGGGVIRQVNMATPWDLTTAVDGVSVNPSGPISGNTADTTISPDGYHFYIYSASTGELFEYFMSEPFQLSSMNLTPVATYDLGFTTNNQAAMDLSNDGRIMYIQYGANLREYSLGIPWDITSISSVFTSKNPGSSGTRGMIVKPDGTRVYLITFDNPDSSFRQFTLGLKTDSLLVGTTSSSNSAKLEINSTVQGFLQSRMTTIQMLAVVTPSTGLSIYDTTSKGPKYYDNTGWVGFEASNVTVYVRSVADLPTPVSSIITLANFTIYKFLNNVNTGSNQLKTGQDTVLMGLNVAITALTGTTSVPLIITNGVHGFEIIDITIVQEGSGDLLSISMTAPQAVTITRGTTLAGGAIRLVTGFGFITTDTFFRTAPIIQDGSGGGVDSINLGGLSALIDLIALDAVILFESGSTTDSFIMSDCALILVAASVGIRVESNAVILSFDLNSNVLQHLDAAAIIMIVENPDDIVLGRFTANAPIGIGTLLLCDPVAAGTFTMAGNTKGLGFDGTNLISIEADTDVINLHVGVTTTIGSTIAAPGLEMKGVAWARGNLISLDANPLAPLGGPGIYIHSGFTTTITDSFLTPGTTPIGLTYDGSNIISLDSSTGIHVHDGLTSTIIQNFPSPQTSLVADITFDGVNLIISDGNSNVFVMKGISGTIQYSFNLSDPIKGITTTDIGIVLSTDIIGFDTVHVYDHPITFDHSSATWDFRDNPGTIGSANRGGSQFTNGITGVDIPLTQNEWTDISDSGTDIFYAAFNGMEKCRLNNEQNGEIIWTGVTERGQLINGLATITRAGGGVNRFYEAAIVINGVIQKDSITSNVLPDASTFATLQTMPITRGLTKDDIIKVQIRNTTDSQNALAISTKLSIN